MLKNTFENDLCWLRNKFRKPVFDESTGLDNETLKANVAAFYDNMPGEPRPIVKARAYEYLLKNIRIDVNEHDFFPSFGCWDRFDRPMAALLSRFYNDIAEHRLTQRELWRKLNTTGCTCLWIDFDHSVPDWDLIMSLGFPGLLDNARKWREKHRANGTLTPDAEAYFSGIEITYTATLDAISRFAEYARRDAVKENERMQQVAASLERLHSGPPQNTFDVLQTIFLYFMFCEHVDLLQVRSLSNLDNLLLPYVERDLRTGTFTESDIRLLMDHFLMQYGSINNYWGHPFYLGGTDEHGNSRINMMSYLILEEFDKLKIPSPKIQIKIAENTPDEFINKALCMIRDGHSSLLFISEEGIARAFEKIGMTAEDARTSDIRGCYELSSRGLRNSNSTACGYLNMLKPFDLILNNGVDPLSGVVIDAPVKPLEQLKTFDDFLQAYTEQIRWIIDANIKVVNDYERFLNLINPTNIFSAAVQNSLLTARDAFFNGCFFNNTSLQNEGLGTAVDALAAIREFVYEKKEITLQELAEILHANWKGHEKLRRKILRFSEKYGNGIPEADKLAETLAKICSDNITGRPNSRGGIWENNGSSARQFIEMGKRTGATPDGRFAKEEMSKNLSPTMGADIRGVTALIRSVSKLDASEFPSAFSLDVMMHPSTVEGTEGLAAWRTLLREYLKHGLSIQFNIFDAKTLKDAQKNPEKYEGLQIRVCGWNVHFTEMNKEEQDMYILRAENIKD